MGNDLEIEIAPGEEPGSYQVQVDSPAGTAVGTMQLDAPSILGRRRELAASVLASAVTSRSGFTTLEEPVRDVGHALFEALFSGRVYGRYTASLQEAARRGEPLRLVLRLRAPGLSGVPWETLFDPESGEYICQREPVVRYVEAAQPTAPLTAIGPLRILGMVAAPRDLPSLDTAEERRRLDAALRELVAQGLVEIEWVESGNWGALQEKLMAGPWHVLHVIGHGGVSAEGGVLALEDETTGKAVHVSAGRFARLLHACRPVPRLVVLNSCSSGEAAADDVLSSTAAALVHSGISATVAMQFAVTDPAALAFSRGFYQALAHNIPVDEAVRLGRIAIDGTSEQTLEWVTPVLYLRTDDTRLFELSAERETAAAPTSPPDQLEEISHEAAKYGLYVQALAAARTQQYDEAITLLDSVITLDPEYRDAAQRRDVLRREQRLGQAYDEARAAEDEEDWEEARRAYDSVLDLDPEYSDAQERRDACQQRLTVSGLQGELRVHAAGDDWPAVLAVSEELARLDPAAADPDGLATSAREILAAQQEQVVERQQVSAPNDWGEQAYDREEQPTLRQEPVPVQPQAFVPEPELEPPPGVAGGRGPDQDGPDEPETADGGRLEEAAPLPILPPDAFAPRRRRRRSSWLLVAGLVALGLVGATVIVATVVGDDGNEPPPQSGVTCWDGSSADTRRECPVPTGTEGLATVFPSMDDACEPASWELAEGVAEVFDCVYDDYTILYTRWERGADRYAAIDARSAGAAPGVWTIDGTFAGRTWTGVPQPGRARPFVWRATYRYWPYEVLVKGVDEDARATGMDQVEARTPREIGLP
jgi:tetratricopeptide (TPR) repeat protein